jgi:hypothetical protein
MLWLKITSIWYPSYVQDHGPYVLITVLVLSMGLCFGKPEDLAKTDVIACQVLEEKNSSRRNSATNAG